MDGFLARAFGEIGVSVVIRVAQDEDAGNHVTVATNDDVSNGTGAFGEHGRAETSGQLDGRVAAAGG